MRCSVSSHRFTTSSAYDTAGSLGALGQSILARFNRSRAGAMLPARFGLLWRFAKALEISTGNLSDWLSGKTEPSAGALTRIYENYNVNLNWLVSGKGTMFLGANIIAEKRAAYSRRREEKKENLESLHERVQQIEKEVRELRERKTTN